MFFFIANFNVLLHHKSVYNFFYLFTTFLHCILLYLRAWTSGVCDWDLGSLAKCLSDATINSCLTVTCFVVKEIVICWL